MNRAERRQERAQQANADRAGLTLEQWQALTPAERNRLKRELQRQRKGENQ